MPTAASPVAAPSVAVAAARRRLALLAFVVALVLAAALGLLGDPRRAPGLTILLHLGAGVALAGGVWAAGRTGRGQGLLSLRLVLLLGLGLRLCFWAFPLSDDVNRYILEGFMPQRGFSPYRTSPWAFAELGGTPNATASATARQRPLDRERIVDDPVWQGVNQKHLTAAYPPLAQWLFRGLARAGGYWPGTDPSGSYRAHKVAALLADLITLLLLARLLQERRLAPEWLALYAWNPLVLAMGVGEAHVDLYQTTLIAAALWGFMGRRRRPWLAWPLLGAAVLVKYFAVVLAPLFLNRRSWKWLPLAGLAGLVALPFELGEMTASLRSFGAEYHYHDLLPRLLRPLLPQGTLPLVLAMLLGVALLWLMHAGWRQARPRPERLHGAWWALLVCLPTVHMWYALPVLALLVLRPCASSLALGVSMGWGYWTYGHLQRTGEWLEFPGIWALVWLPPLLLLARELHHGRRRLQADLVATARTH